MARSISVVAVAAPLLLLSVLVSTAAAARAVGGDTVQDACSKTQFPKICAESLAKKPESQKATPRKLAELFVTIAAEKGAAMAKFVHGKYNAAANKDDALFVCYDSCSDDVEEAVAHLNGLLREPTDGKFLELKSWLSSTLGGTSTCEDSCKDTPKSGDREAVVNFSLDFEKLQRITLDLITEAASGSVSSSAGGIALPPSAPKSYGAAGPPAPPYGGGSAGSDAGSADAPASSDAEGPAPASGPSSGADAPAKAYGGSAASGPAADAPAAGPASGPSGGASGPSSSKSSGAPGPSSSKSSSSAAAPDAGDDDDDDDQDDGSS